MYILGVAILIKTKDKYEGTASNVANGQIFVGLDRASSREHSNSSLQKIIYKIYKLYPNEMPNAVFGYMAINDDGTGLFVDRKEASKACNLNTKNDTIFSYDVKWLDEKSYIYKEEQENMLKIIKKYGLTEEDYFY